MANIVHEPGSKVRVLRSLGEDEVGRVLMWHQIEEQIAVKGGRGLTVDGVFDILGQPKSLLTKVLLSDKYFR